MALSTRDKSKPFILVAAAIAGLMIQHFVGEAVPAYESSSQSVSAATAFFADFCLLGFGGFR